MPEYGMAQLYLIISFHVYAGKVDGLGSPRLSVYLEFRYFNDSSEQLVFNPVTIVWKVVLHFDKYLWFNKNIFFITITSKVQHYELSEINTPHAVKRETVFKCFEKYSPSFKQESTNLHSRYLLRDKGIRASVILKMKIVLIRGVAVPPK